MIKEAFISSHENCYLSLQKGIFLIQPVERPARKSPSPSREVPSTTTFETPNEQQEQRELHTPTPVQSPEDNRVSSMSDATNITVAEENPALQKFPGMFRFDTH